jgi:hypothetical protein
MDKKTTPQTNAKDIVNTVVSAFNSSWNYRSGSWHDRWQDMNKLYNSERVYVGYNGISDTFVPMSYSLVETMVAATSGDKPMVEYMATKPEQDVNTEVLNALFAYYWDLDQWTPKLIQHNRAMFKLGTSILKVYWNIDHPCLEIIPVRDFFCDPAATFFNRNNARFMGHRFLADKRALEKERVIDPETGDFVAKYKNLDKLGKFDSGDETDKQDKDSDMGNGPDETTDDNQIEVICYETLDKVYYIGNRQELIYENDNYFKQRQQFLGYQNPTGMFSYIVDSFSPDESQLYGKSVIEPIAKHQELLNDLTNQNIDAVSWAIDPEMELDPQYSSYLDKMRSATGNVYPFKPGSYQAVQKPIIPSNVFNERTNIKNEIREATAIDEIIKGIAMGGDTTATEVKAQQSSAGRRFGLIVSMLENGGYYQLAKLVFQLVQLYVTAPMMFRVVGNQEIDWKEFDPKMFKGEYEPRIKLKSTMEYEERFKMRDLKELYTAMLGNPFIDQANLTRYIIQKGFDLDPKEVQDLVKTNDQLSQEAGNSQGGPQGKAASGQPKVLINYKDAPPDIQAQMEMESGYQPSVTHEGSMATAATGQMAAQALHGEQIAPAPTTPPQPIISKGMMGGQGGQ